MTLRLQDDEIEERLLGAVCALVSELHPAAMPMSVGIDSRLDADLGLDSLALVELRSRVEHEFGEVLPDRVFEAPTLEGWVRCVRGASAPGQAATLRTDRHRERRGTTAASATGWPQDAATLPEVLDYHVRRHPERVHVRLLHTTEEESASEVLTYGQLATVAASVAARLQHNGLRRGDSVAVMLPTGADYFGVFLGILVAGGVPVPIYPPARPAGLEDHLRRQVHILENSQATFLVTVPAARLAARLMRPLVPSLQAILSPEDLCAGSADAPMRPDVSADDTALIQFTSGSTGNPKGVVLTHRHLLANIRAMGRAAEVTSADVLVSWLPLYHDMGLIAAWLASLYFGFELVVMPPTAFLARPLRWLRAVQVYGGTLSASPNFGYELSLRHVGDEELRGLDLSSWRVAFNGAEPVSPETIRRFAERFGPCGFRPDVMTPVFGLAEAGVGLTFPPMHRGPVVDAVDRLRLIRTGSAEPITDDGATSVRFVSCGRPLPGYQVRVVDAAGKELPERHEGRIEFTGPSATPGYFRNEEATRALRHGVWLDTGDLGYMAQGELYLTGRVKDLVIRAGRNLHPEELEEAVGDLPGIRKGCVAAFAATDPGVGTERLVVLAETRLTDAEAGTDLRRRITTLTVDLLGTPPDDVLLAPPGTVLKTSSGKIRRAACRQLYEEGSIGRPTTGARRQLARFAWRGTGPRVRRTTRAAADLLFAVYAWTVVIAVGLPVWLVVLLLPTLDARWRVLRAAGRVVCRLCGVTLQVSGTPQRAEACVVVANHASFIDGLILVLCLPSPVAFVAGGEFAAQRIAGPFLRRLGCEFVNRDDPQQLRRDAARITGILRDGRSVAFFPEGSVHRAVGLRPFHLGAFAAACDSGVPVVPVGIRGSRDVVRPGGRFPRRGAVAAAIGAPIYPCGEDWSATLALRDDVRTAVLALSGEPELGG